MNWIYTFLFLISFPILGHGQQTTLLTNLNATLNETSGLIYLNQKIITHNDSGGAAKLYELDSITGNVTREVTISNASNTDWEDICYDDTYIYIADFGNNNGTRTDLKVYRVSIADYTANNSITADVINFSYADQADFTPSPLATNFDAEAMIALNGSLYIFTKNWIDGMTNIYVLPKTIGTHSISKVDTVNVLGLITGATFNATSSTIVLSGYTDTEAIVVEISNYTGNNFSSGTINRYTLSLPGSSSYQVEGIATKDESKDEYLFTSEDSSTGDPGLFRLNTSVPLSVQLIQNETALIYPNPTSDIININSSNFSSAEIYTILGELIKSTTQKKIDISNLQSGIYFVVLKNAMGTKIATQKMIVK